MVSDLSFQELSEQFRDLSLATRPFSFLDLPAELRNLCYAYALTSDSGLLHHYRGSSGSILVEQKQGHKRRTEHPKIHGVFRESHRSSLVFNQLQFVSRQLRHETKDLELRFNSVVFASLLDRGSSRHINFLDTLQLHPKYLWLTSVHIHTHVSHLVCWHTHQPKHLREWLFQLVDFCKENAHVRTRLIADNWKVTDESRISLRVGAILAVICGLDDTFDVMSSHPTVTLMQNGSSWKRFWDLPKFMEQCEGLDNLVIFPAVSEEEVENIVATRGEDFVRGFRQLSSWSDSVFEMVKETYARMMVSCVVNGLTPFSDRLTG